MLGNKVSRSRTVVPQKSISGHNDRNLSVYRVGNTVQTLERFFLFIQE